MISKLFALQLLQLASHTSAWTIKHVGTAQAKSNYEVSNNGWSGTVLVEVPSIGNQGLFNGLSDLRADWCDYKSSTFDLHTHRIGPTIFPSTVYPFTSQDTLNLNDLASQLGSLTLHRTVNDIRYSLGLSCPRKEVNGGLVASYLRVYYARFQMKLKLAYKNSKAIETDLLFFTPTKYEEECYYNNYSQVWKNAAADSDHWIVNDNPSC